LLNINSVISDWRYIFPIPYIYIRYSGSKNVAKITKKNPFLMAELNTGCRFSFHLDKGIQGGGSYKTRPEGF